MEQYENKAMYDIADQFINLANELSRTDRSGRVGMAIRFAAARFSIFEASTQTDSLDRDRDKFAKMIEEDFAKLVQCNMDDYIRLLAAK